ncbi:hypothetical protein N656DRAFT_780742 [Canariomyces notabilis]|uniref:Uncharacterized protein n=1 Tax=Canariomyces notabilis TaxID=2074819 RepID=A0AAN6TBR6_9PEZI|nr:hypothetical protein N656DRAFT_780742 [Canariomyces arenarius]
MAPQTRRQKVYESAPVPQQVHFPARRRVVRTYGARGTRRSLPAGGLAGLQAEVDARRRLRQQTLTQVGYVRSQELEDEDLFEQEERQDSPGDTGDVEGSSILFQDDDGVGDGKGKKPKQGRAGAKASTKAKGRRRKTMGDTPAQPSSSSRSSFHTQTLTQFLGGRGEIDRGLRIEGEGEEGDGEMLLPSGRTPTKLASSKRPSPTQGMDPHTPSNKRIKVNLDEVPSSQPTPFTPMLGYSPLHAARSPLKEKSTNVDAPLPTLETVSKRPRNLVIQDSYSSGSSAALPSSSSVAAGTSPKVEQRPKREPLSEIPVASLELGVSPREEVETPTRNGGARGIRVFTEIPDSDAELESNWSTPFKGLSTQQTPSKRRDAEDFVIASDPSSTPRGGMAGESGSPTQTGPGAHDESVPSTGKSNKENEPGPLNLDDDEESTASEEEGPGTPTPTMRKTRSQAAKASQRTGNTGSQSRIASSQSLGGTSKPTNHGSNKDIATGNPFLNEEKAPSSPTAATRKSRSQRRTSVASADGRNTKSTPKPQDLEEMTASEDEGRTVPTQILPKPAGRKASPAREVTRNNCKATPEVLTSESSATGNEHGTPTPLARKVRIEVPPSPDTEEVYKETPRKPAKKSSPILQRHTQGRSQFYSQGLESQRVPMEVIRSLGPQTDRSDILISIGPEIVDQIVEGTRDHEFRSYKFPIQVLRCWIYVTDPVNEVKYMATLGPAKMPGQIDSASGLGNAQFNAGTSNCNFAYELLQVYQLNNPVPLADMPDNGLGNGPPDRYRYLPPAIVGQLMANLRCALFAEGDEEEAGATTSQELEEQLRSDIIQSTQMWYPHEEEEEEVIPASQDRPTSSRRAGPSGGISKSPAKDADVFARPSAPPVRASQRIRNQRQSQRQSQHSMGLRANFVRPSQATTASDLSSSPPATGRPSYSSPEKQQSSYSSSSVMALSVPRPPFSQPSLPDLLLDVMREDEDGSLIRLPPPTAGSSSQAVLLPPDSLLVEDEEVRQPPPVVIWDSEEDEEEEDAA